MRKIILVSLGSLLAIAGGILVILPTPLGFMLFIPGVALLVMGSDSVAGWVERRRARNAEVDQKMTELCEKIPDPIATPLQETKPEEFEDLEVRRVANG